MKPDISKTANPWRFFLLALGISWFFWAWVILLKWHVWRFPAVLFGAVGLFGPALAEIILILRNGDKEQWRDYRRRVLDFRRIRGGWWAVILLTFPILNGIAIMLNLLLTGEQPDFETAARLLSRPWMILPFAVFILLFGPLPEELGWRGYGLDSLQVRWNGLTSSLVLGAVWALWHLPLFFMVGTFQHDEVGFGTPGFWSFCLGTTISSVLFTWIYNNTNRSTLSAILFHFSINFSGEFLTPTEQARFYQLLLLIIAAVVVVIIWGPETLTRQRRNSAKWQGILRRFFGKGVCPYQLSFILDSTLRRLILSPERLADRLHLEEDSHVLEVGPGPGYFSVEVARRVSSGRLDLLDVQKEMLEKARQRIAKTGLLHNAGFVQGDATTLPFEEGRFDVAFLVAVLGEVPDPSACLRELYRALRPQGLLSITEQPGDPDALSRSTIRSLAEQQGFVFAETHGKRKNFTVNFRKPLVAGRGNESDLLFEKVRG